MSAEFSRDYVEDLFSRCKGLALFADGRFSARPSPKELKVNGHVSRRQEPKAQRPRDQAAAQPAVPKKTAISRGRRPRSSAHFKVFKGMLPPPRLPNAARSRNCHPNPSPWKAATIVQQPPWNQRQHGGLAAAAADPSATMTPQVAEAAETATRRALAWQPWLISKMALQTREAGQSDDALPEEEIKELSTLPSFRRRPIGTSETMTTSMGVDSDFARSLKASFDLKAWPSEPRSEKRNAVVTASQPIHTAETIPMWQMHKLAREMNMTLEGVVEAKAIFDDHDEDRSGRLSFEEIARVIETLMERQVADEQTVQKRIQSGQAKQLLNQWLKFVPQNNFDLNFEDFLLWYSCTGFMTDLLVDDKEMRIRSLAKINGLDAMCMDRVRKSFAAFDLDRSGEVDEEEFENVLREVMNIPSHLQIPPSRIRFFWKEIDEDDSGKASFHEFLNFWLCRFGKAAGSAGSQGQLVSIEDYYRATRRIGAAYLDPPPELDELTEAIQRFVAHLTT